MTRWRWPFSEPEPAPPSPHEAAWLEELRAGVDPGRILATVAALPAPRHRASDPRRIGAAERSIVAGLRDAGWHAYRRRFSGPPVGWNVEALRPGQSSATLALVAHHDTVAGSGGADDNGSGVAVLLEAARLLAPWQFRRTVLLATVDLEETGRFTGTEALIALAARRTPIAGAIVLESVGFVDPRPGSQRIPPGLGLLYRQQLRAARSNGLAGTWTLLIHRRSSAPLARAMRAGLRAQAGELAAFSIRDPVDLPLIGRALPWTLPTVRHLARSDHAAFWRRGIPAICVTDTADLRNPHYHGPGDLPETLDADRMAQVAVATAFAIGRLAGRIV